MEERAAELVRLLGLQVHPEGGHFTEVFRSAREIGGQRGGARVAVTHIYFLLAAGERSRWHRLASDEIWQWYEGSALDLLTIAPSGPRLERRRLGPLDSGARPAHEVPARTWQAARPIGAYTLAGCTVAPGFEYADFELLADCPAERDRLRAAGVALDDLL